MFCSFFFVLPILTFSAMEQRFLNSNSSVVSVPSVEFMFDIRCWLEPYIEEVHKHTAPHIFMFCKNKQRKAEMFYIGLMRNGALHLKDSYSVICK